MLNTSRLLWLSLALTGSLILMSGLRLPVKQDTVVSSQTSADTLVLYFGGDMMGHSGMFKAAWNPAEKAYQYDHWFNHVRPHISAADFACANLEVTLAGAPYSGYPQFSSPDAFASGLKSAGIDLLITANNHSQDRGRRGLERTLRVLDSLDLPHTGTFRDPLERSTRYPWLGEVKGVRLAVLNASYGTNGLVVQQPNIVNLIDTAQMRQDLLAAKKAGAQFIIVTLHWGLEYQRQENADQMKLARWLASKGADAIIGMHPHVVQPMKVITDPKDSSRNVPVVFSLGNYMSNQRERFRDGGIGAVLRLVVRDGVVKWDSWGYLPIWCYVGGSPYGFYPVPVRYMESVPARLQMSPADLNSLVVFARDTRQLLSGVPEADPGNIRKVTLAGQ